jgi:hypothetical protein
MQKTTLTIRTIVMCPQPKFITLLTRHNITRDDAADISEHFGRLNPHLQIEATYTTEDRWQL